LSAADAIKAYEELAGKVFSEKKAKGKDGTFKATRLEEAVKSVVASKLGHDRANARMCEVEESLNKCRS
jgi:hypothetical protein